MRSRQRSARGRRGTALVVMMVAIAALASMAGVVLSFGMSSSRESDFSRSRTRALYLAEAGLSDALARLQESARTGSDAPAALGTADAPRSLGAGRYWVSLTANADGSFRVRSHGRAGRSERVLEAVMAPAVRGAYSHALFAGGPHELRLAGHGSRADRITGDVYSGGDVRVQGDASVDGAIAAGGVIHGAAGEIGAERPSLDISSMDYPNNHDVDVAAAFAADAFLGTSAAGVVGEHLPEEHPAHIFTRNPVDRSDECASTPVDDYFLEDPYEDLPGDANQPFPVSLSGKSGRPGPDGSELVYFIAGNLWVHSLTALSLQFVHGEDEDVRVTFVVQGDIYFTDNLIHQDAERDALAFIAIKSEGDDHGDESGNIHFGRSDLGDVQQMDAFLYAENDLKDYHHSMGQTPTLVRGNLAAGNRLEILRDTGGWGTHSRLTVEFDERLRRRHVELPGIPVQQADAEGYEIVSWREVGRKDPS